MKFLLPIFILLFSFSVTAQRTLTPQAFQVNVRPVLNGILNDFYQMISMFPAFPKELVDLVDDMDKFTSDKEVLKGLCPRTVNKQCSDTLEKMRARLSTLQNKTLVLISRIKPAHNLYMTTLSGIRVINEFQIELERLKAELDNTAFLMKAEIPQKNETYGIIKKLDRLSTLLSLAVVEFIPYNYKEDFRHFYFNFVHPVQIQISKHQNYEFVNRNVNSLNFALNLLNMNLTKRNKKTPEGMAPYLSTIHNRWNSLLRYYY